MENIENIEERIRKYKASLRDNKAIYLVVKGQFEARGTSDNFKIVCSPKNERELKYAEAVATAADDALDLLLRRSSNMVIPTPLEENEALKLIINELKALLNGEEYDSSEEYKSMAKQARLYYGRVTINTSDFSDYVIEQTGANERDRNHLKIFKKYFKKHGGEDEFELPVLKGRYADMTDEEIDGYLEFATEFHALCEKYKKSLVNDFVELLFGRSK